MTRWTTALISLGLTLFTAAAWGQNTERLHITGSSTVAPLMQDIARAYEQVHPGVRIDVQTGGSTRGIVDVRRGLADLGMVSRALGEREQDLLAHTIARDGVAMIVHRDNPVEQLSREQIRAIYTGDIRNWSALGGPDRPITVIHKAEGRSTLEVFLDYLALRNSQIRPQVVIGDNQQGIRTLVGNRDAIAYVSIGAAAHEAERGSPLKLLPMAGVPARTEAVRSGDYPLSRELNLVSAGEPAEAARQFLDFVRSPTASQLIEAHFFVPLATME